MQLDIVKNTKRNIIFGFFNKVIVLLLPFLSRTIIIDKIGAEYLGLDGLFGSVLHVLNLSELGFSSAIVYSMYKPIANNETDTICALLALYRKVYRMVGIVIGVIGLIIMPILPHLIKDSCPADVNLYILYIIYLSNTIISYLMFAYKTSILNAFQREDIVSTINTISRVFLNVLQFIVVLLFKNYYIYVIILPFSTILNNLITEITVRKKFPQFVCRGRVSEEIQADLRIKVAGLMVSRLCGVSRNAFDSIFVSSFLGLIATTMYNNYYYIVTALTSIMGIISTAIIGGVGNRVALNGAEENLEDMQKLDFIYMTISGWCAICLCCLYQPFMTIWVGEELLFPFHSMILFVIYFYCLKIGDIRSVYVATTGLWWESKYRAIMEALSNIVLNYLLGKYFGVNGIVVATIITILVFNFLYGSKIIFDNYFGRKKHLKYVVGHLRYAAVTVGIGFITYVLCNMYKGDSMVEILVRVFICCVVPTILYILIYKNTKMWMESIGWLSGMIHFNTKKE